MNNKPKPFYTQAYIDRGTGHPVVLLHGLFGNISMWRSVVRDLEDQYRVIIPRLPIFDLPVQYVNIEYMTDVLHEFLDWHQLGNVTLVGHEAGGQIALMYAHRYPQNLDRLVLSGSTGLLDRIHLDTDEVDYDFVTEKVKDGFYDDALVTGNLINRVYATLQQPSSRYAIENIMKPSEQNDVRSFLSSINIPVLLLWGAEDRITPVHAAYHFHDLLPNAELRIIGACGHLPVVEQPQLFNEYLLSFLNGNREEVKNIA